MRWSSRVLYRPAVVAAVALFLLNLVAASGALALDGPAAPGVYPSSLLPPASGSGGHPPASLSPPGTVGGGRGSTHLPLNSGSNVTFNETGLPAGTNWSVTLNGTSANSTSDAIWFSVANGTYSFSVPALAGYVPSPVSGFVSANIPSVFESISFSAFTFPLNFTEAGLPGATSWSVNVSGILYSTLTAQLSLNVPNGSYAFVVDPPAGFLPVPENGTAHISNASATIPIAFSPILYSVLFSQTGLTATNWSVNLSGSTLQSNGTNLSFVEPNGTYSFSVGFVSGYQASPTSGSLVVNGSAVTENLTFAALPPSKYPLSFNETGLAPGTLWSVSLNMANLTSTGSTIVFLKANGSFPFTVAPVPGYLAAPGNGTVKVQGPTARPIVFTPVLYAVNFTESGLPRGTSWSVELGSVQLSATLPYLAFSVPNGTSAYVVERVMGYTDSPSSGNVVISGAAASVTIAFTPVPYSVEWTETGLPAGTHWSVTVNGTSWPGTSSRITGSEPNGTYPFSVGAVPGYVGFPPSGNVTVSGAAVVDTISFSTFEFPVTVTETGLPSGTDWSANVGGTFLFGSGSSLLFAKANGTYTFRVAAVAGFTEAPASGTVTVAGASAQVAVVYTPLPPGTYAIVFTESGLPAGSNWSVNLSGTIEVSSSDQIVFDEHNGTYPYLVGSVAGFLASPSSGSVPVEGTTNSITIHFKPVPTAMYSVIFSEQGLASGTPWTVTFNATVLHGASVTLVALAANGSYNFTVGAVSGYNSSVSTGTVLVNGTSSLESIVFTPPTRSSVTFSETGLATGTSWSVTLNGSTEGSTGKTVVFNGFESGSYAFTVTGSGYTATPSAGNVTVGDSDVAVSLSFTSSAPSHSASTGSSLSTPTLVFLGAMGLILLVAAGIALATRERQRGHP